MTDAFYTGLLIEAHKIIHGDRERTHGDPSRNLREIAAKWSVTLGHGVSPAQVALCMIDLKTVRAAHHPETRDHWIDIAGYAGLVDRCGFLQEPGQPCDCKGRPEPSHD